MTSVDTQRVAEGSELRSTLPPPGVPPQGFRVQPAWRTPVTTGVLASAGTVVLGLGNPNTTHVPLCPLKAVTGLDCPLCGGLRAVHSLTRFDLAGALDHNLIFTLSVPMLIVGYVIWLARSLDHPVLPRWQLPSWTYPALLVVGLVFAVVRNIPAFSWLGSGV